MTPPAQELIVLVDDDGRSIGTMPKPLVHHGETPLHRAFSAYLFDEAGRLLITRRALDKATFPGMWTNTVCGHPGPDEDDATAIARRAGFELGLGVADGHVDLGLPGLGHAVHGLLRHRPSSLRHPEAGHRLRRS